MKWITLSELSGEHLHKWVEVSVLDGEATGVLRGMEYWTECVNGRSLLETHEEMITLRVGDWTASFEVHDPDVRVVVFDDEA